MGGLPKRRPCKGRGGTRKYFRQRGRSGRWRFFGRSDCWCLGLPVWGAVVLVGLAAYGGSELAKWLFGEAAEIAESLSELFRQGKLYVPRRDPLVLDLDGDGIETVGMNAAAPIFFDHDADGIRTGTGWVRPDDGFLILDRNGNGRVDDGRELFGDATPLNGSGTLDPSAGVAADGFAALTREDTNSDGVVNASDARWGSLRIWRDTNQDGVSQTSELVTLAGLGITGIQTQSTTVNQALGNGNVIHKRGTFIRSNGTQGTAGTVQDVSNLNFIEDTFHREFADTIPITAVIADLPNMSGSGSVRDLREAAALGVNGSALLTQLSNFAGDSSRQGQLGRLDALLSAWAETAGRPTMQQRIASLSSGSTTYVASWQRIGNTARPTSGSLDAWNALVAETTRKIEVLETFNGSHFFDFQGLVTGTQRGAFGLSLGSAVGSSIPINVAIDPQQLDLIISAYQVLSRSVFESLALQTRLKSYTDAIVVDTTDTGISLDFSGVEQRLETARITNPQGALLDAIELANSTAPNSVTTGWRPLADRHSPLSAV